MTSPLEAQRANPGLWLAMRDETVIATALTPHDLVRQLEERGISNAIILRSPAEDEPELVGLG